MADETKSPAPTETPAPTTSRTKAGGGGQEAKAFEYGRLLREARAVAGYEEYVVAGAAAHHGWDSDTKLTVEEFKAGVESWLNNETSRED